MYTAAMWEFQRIHFDGEWAREREGLPGPVVHGPLLGNYLAQTITRWSGPAATLARLTWRNEGLALVGELLTCGGTVTGKRRADGAGLVDCDLWIEAPGGKRLVSGAAVIRFAASGRVV